MQNIHHETITTGVALVMSGADIVSIGGQLKILGCRKLEPHRYQLEELRDALNRCQNALDAYEQNLALHGEEASVEIVDEHQTDIEDGTASFEAYREKMRSV